MLDKNGKEILPIKFSYISSFKGKLATICIGGEIENDWPYKVKGGKWGVIDDTGYFVKECVSDREDVLEENKYDNKEADRYESFEKPSVILSDSIPNSQKTQSYSSWDYGYNSYYDDDEEGDGDEDALHGCRVPLGVRGVGRGRRF